MWPFRIWYFKIWFWLNPFWCLVIYSSKGKFAVLCPFFGVDCTSGHVLFATPWLIRELLCDSSVNGPRLVLWNHPFHWEGQKLRPFRGEVKSYYDLVHNQLPQIVKDHGPSALVFIRTCFNVSFSCYQVLVDCKAKVHILNPISQLMPDHGKRCLQQRSFFHLSSCHDFSNRIADTVYLGAGLSSSEGFVSTNWCYK